MLVDIRYIFWGFIGLILGTALIVAIVYLILTLKKLSTLLDNLNSILDSNKENLNKTSNNIADITGNVKDISDVATEATADILVARDSLVNNLVIFKDILTIILNTFKK